MSGMQLGALIFVAMLGMMLARVPIGAAMLIAGAAGYVHLTDGVDPLMNWLKNVTYARLSSYDLIVIPLFLLMGQFATHGGLSSALFRCVSAFMGHYRGGAAIASIGASGCFGAICGSSLATAATMGQVTLPELRRLGYSDGFATGTVAAGGTLGILIPPSIPLVIYAILVEESIGKLFMAAVIPGVIAIVGYMLVVKISVALNPASGPAGPRVSLSEKFRSLVSVWPVILVFLVVIVGIYGGWATPAEASAIGAAACGVLAIVTGGMRWPGLRDSVLGMAQATAMIYLVLLGADMLNTTMALTQMPNELAIWVKELGVSPMLVLMIILLIYIFLGCVMESMAMIMLTIPVFYPMIMGLDFWGLSQQDKSIWFGILALMVVEIGLITPPVGMNVYLVNRMAKNVPLSETFHGVIPFLVSDLIRIVLLMFFPALALYLVHLF